MPRSKSKAFPVGLYGALLLALCWLLMPTLFAPVERTLLGVAMLPQRWLAWFSAPPVTAAASALQTQCASLRVSLAERSWQHDVAPGKTVMPKSLEPLRCSVLRSQRIGGGGLPSELQLDRTYEELAGCIDLVTKGSELIGFLARPGIGTAAKDRPQDPARVLLLNHSQSRAVAAAVMLRDEAPLHCVVESAAAVDPSPLRTLLHDDPYRAASVRQGGALVRTLQLQASFIAAVPEGLSIGKTRVFGYQRADGESLTIGIYVDPVNDTRALSYVVAWQGVPQAQPTELSPRYVTAQLRPLPDGRGGRCSLFADAVVPDGAAVVMDGRCLGRARGLAFGQGICTSLAASKKPWAVLLLPDDPALPPQELFGEVVRTDGVQAWFRPRSTVITAGGSGFLFTGANGPFCPAGLLLGRTETESGRNLLRVETAAQSGPILASVVVEGR